MRSLLVVFLLGLVVLGSARVASADDAIAFSDSGLRLGATVIYPKPVDGAAYDPALDLIWFTSKNTLQVIDLRDAKHKPILIAKKFPKVGFLIAGVSKADFNADYTSAYAALEIGKKSKITAEDGVYAPVDQDSTDKLKKSIKKARLVGTKWLKKLAKRTVRSVTVPTPAPLPNVKLPPDLCQSDDPDSCGEATSFGTTELQLVVTEYSCGDACYTGCVLYDPASKKFAAPLETSTWGKDAKADGCDDYAFDADGKTYYKDTMRCVLDKGVTCTNDTPWTYVGIAPAAAAP
jgi:hypothetical protein